MVKLSASIHSSFSEMVTEDLRRRNVTTVVDFIATDPVKLATFTGLSHMDILQVKQHILEKFGGTKKNASELLTIEHNNIISTSIACLDELLKGGLYPGQSCEICGLSASGKTQLCLTIAANAVAKSDIVTWYLDTKRDFSRLRFEEILRARNFRQTTIEDALQRTKVYHVRSSHQMIQALRHLVSFYKTERNSVLERKRPLLVIIDSLPAVIFKVTRDTRHSDLETTYELDDLAEVCRFLTRECQAVVITVNSVTRWDSTKKDDLSILTPALGKHWARIPVTRLLLTREHGETRRIFVWKDPRFEENPSCVVSVGDAGITML